MEQRYLLLNDVARILGLKAHQITYALATGQVPEPALEGGEQEGVLDRGR